MLKPYVRFCSAMLFVLHPEMLSPQQDQDFKWVSASDVGSWGSSTAILWPHWRHLGANFGDVGAVLKAIWDHFGRSADAPPLALKASQKLSQNTKTPPKR